MKFRRKPRVVDAVQFTQEMYDSGDNLPNTVFYHTTDVKAKYSPRFGVFKVESVKRIYYVYNTKWGESVELKVGDWIVTLWDNHVEVFLDKKFREEYEEA